MSFHRIAGVSKRTSEDSGYCQFEWKKHELVLQVLAVEKIGNAI